MINDFTKKWADAIDKSIKKSPYINRNFLDYTYFTDELPQREKELEAIEVPFRRMILKQTPVQNFIIYGKPGTGKTSVVKVLQKQVNGFSEKNGLNYKVIYINCYHNNSFFPIMSKINDDLNLGISQRDPRKIQEALFKRQKDGEWFTIILDEGDAVRPGGRKKEDMDHIIYSLHRQNSDYEGKVNLILITSNTQFKNRYIESQTISSVGFSEFIFNPYNANQLAEILKFRVEKGVKNKYVPFEIIELVAANAAKMNGDARWAIRLLGKSIDIAYESGSKCVDAKHVLEGLGMIDLDIISELIQGLPEQQQILLYAICNYLSKNPAQKEMTTGLAFSNYCNLCKHFNRKAVSQRWVKDYLNDLDSMSLIRLRRSGTGVRGRTSIIELDHPAKEIRGILAKSLQII